MECKEIAEKATELLKKEYPDAICSLDYKNPYELLIATILSAQCTDARVNMVTPELFSKYPSFNELALASEEDVSSIIHSCGFYNSKSHNIVSASKIIMNEYCGKLPDNMENLTKLPGVGRKVANLILGDVFHQPSYVCDTHCIRITNLLGITDSKDPAKCEMELRELLDPAESGDFCHRLVMHGRRICIARHPKCGECILKSICKSFK